MIGLDGEPIAYLNSNGQVVFTFGGEARTANLAFALRDELTRAADRIRTLESSLQSTMSLVSDVPQGARNAMVECLKRWRDVAVATGAGDPEIIALADAVIAAEDGGAA